MNNDLSKQNAQTKNDDECSVYELDLNSTDSSYEGDISFSRKRNKSKKKKGASSLQIEYEIVPGKRQNSKLLWSSTELQFYKFNTKLSTGNSYLCYINGCNCRVLLKNDGTCFKTDSSKVHNHPTNEELYEQLSIANEMKTKCKEDASSKSVKEIYDEVLME